MLHRRGFKMRVWEPQELGKAWATLDIRGDVDGIIDRLTEALCDAGIVIDASYDVIRRCGPRSEIDCYRMEIAVP